MKRGILLLLACAFTHIFTFAQWASLGPSGGFVKRGIQIGNVHYVITTSGIFTTADGIQFQFINSNLPVAFNRILTNLCFHNGVMYAFIHNGAGYFRSYDTGKTWQNIKKDVGIPTFCQGLFIHKGKLCTGNDNGFFYSDNEGTDWTKASTPINAWFESVNDVLYRFGYTGALLRYSPDLGVNWVNCDTGLDIAGRPEFVHFVNGKYYTFNNNIYESEDGLHWKKINKSLKKSQFGGNFYLQKNVVHNGIIIGSGGGNVNVSYAFYQPGDTNYSEFKGPRNGLGYTNTFISVSNLLVINVDEDLYHSSDTGKTWILNSKSGISTKNISMVGYFGNALYAGGYSDLFRSVDKGNNWTKLNKNFEGDIYDMTVFNDTLYTAAGYGGLFVSTDQGLTWSTRNFYTSYPSSLSNYKNQYLFCGFGDNLIYRRSGKTWSSFIGNVSSGAFSKVHVAEDVVLAAVHRMNTNDNWGIHSSSVFQPTWVKKADGLPPIYDVNCFGSVKDTVYAGLGGFGVYMSTDTGNTWGPLNKGIEKRDINSIAMADRDVIIATDSGIFLLKKDSIQWRNITGNITSRNIADVFFYNNVIYVSGDMSGCWSMPYTPSTGPVNSTSAFLKSASVFPNPTSGNITFQIPDNLGKNPHIVVFGSNGKEVFSKSFGACERVYTLDLQEEGLLPGVYFFTFLTDSNIHTGKFILR